MTKKPWFDLTYIVSKGGENGHKNLGEKYKLSISTTSRFIRRLNVNISSTATNTKGL